MLFKEEGPKASFIAGVLGGKKDVLSNHISRAGKI